MRPGDDDPAPPRDEPHADDRRQVTMAETCLTSRGAAQPTREKLRVMYSAYWKTLSGIPATGGSVVFSQRRVSFRPCTDQRNVVKPVEWILSTVLPFTAYLAS